MPLTEVEDLADTRIAQKISQLKGVGVVSISGGQRPAVRVVVNPRALAAYGLNLDDLRTTINDANQNGPKGTFDGPTRAYTINTNDQIRNARRLRQYRRRLQERRRRYACRDVATLVSGAENTKLGGWMNTTPALIINVQRQPGANVVDVVNRIQALLPTLQAALPPGVDVAMLTDRTTTIRASVARRRVRAGARRGAGGAGDLPVPAQRAGHDHSEPVGAAVADRHVRASCTSRISASTTCR